MTGNRPLVMAEPIAARQMPGGAEPTWICLRPVGSLPCAPQSGRLNFPAPARILPRSIRPCSKRSENNIVRTLGGSMRRIISLLVVAGLFLAGPAFAADPIVGTWKLNVAKSRFASGAELTAGSRVYTEANGLYTLNQTLTGKDGKDKSNHVQYRNGKEEKQSTAGPADTTL